MELQLRPPRPRFHPLMRPRRGFEGMGAADTSRVACADLTPWQQSQDPRCGGGPSGPATFVQPTVIAAPNCTDPAGNALADPACVEQLQQIQAQNMAARNKANYDVLRANCEQAWAENDARYAALGLPQPANDCAERTFGLTPVGDYTGGVNILTPDAQRLITGSGPSATQQITGTGVVFSFTNLTTGNNGQFLVGDKWQVKISGAPANHPVTVTGGKNSANDTTAMGTTDAQGNFAMNGAMTAAEVGAWQENWKVGGSSVASFGFTVSAPGTVTPPPKKTDTSATSSDLFSGSVSIGGTSIPTLALGVGALVVLFMVMKK